MPLVAWVVSNVILALALALAARFAQRRLGRPAVARFLWVLVLVKLVTPPLVTVPLGQTSGPVACTLGMCGCDHHSRTQTFARDTLPWILLSAWSIGAGATVSIAWRRWIRFQRLIAQADSAPPEWQALAAGIASELSLRRSPEVLAVPGRLPPLVVPSRLRPRVLVPIALLDRLSASQRAALLLHELVHVQRGDHLVRMLELTVGVAYWWLPVIGSIGRQLRDCEEACCDAAVVAHRPDARRDYAKLLLDVVEFANPLRPQITVGATAMSAAHDLEKRLRAILEPGRRTGRRQWAGALMVGVACAVLPCRLHPDFIGRPIAASSAGPRVAVEGTSPSRDDRDVELSKNCCCPS
jgi:bla regulator protein blaR1